MVLLVGQSEHGPGLADRVAAGRVGGCRTTAESVRQRFALEDLEAALGHRPRNRNRFSVVDGNAIPNWWPWVCSDPPDGGVRWTMHLLADEIQRLWIVASTSHETVRKVVKIPSSH